MATKINQLIVMARNAWGYEFPVRVRLPFDEGSRRLVDMQLQSISIAISEEDKRRFLDEIAYLPADDQTLKRAEEMHRQGYDWHTACQKARNPQDVTNASH